MDSQDINLDCASTISKEALANKFRKMWTLNLRWMKDMGNANQRTTAATATHWVKSITIRSCSGLSIAMIKWPQVSVLGQKGFATLLILSRKSGT